MKKTSLFIIVLISALLMTACSTETSQPANALAAVQPQSLIAEGRIQPVNMLEHAFMLSGQVAEVFVQDGENITKGQPLARLSDSPEANAALVRAQQEVLSAQQALDRLETSAGVQLAESRLAYLEAENKVDEAKTSYEETGSDEDKAALEAAEAALELAQADLQKLEDGEGIDPDQLAAAQARLDAANAGLVSAQAMIDSLVLKANIDGTIVDLSLQVGQQVTAGVPVMLIADYSDWLVKTENLTELEVMDVEKGQEVEVVLDALPELTLVGEVTHINARYEEKRGDITYTVTILLKQTNPEMRWGMTAAVRFTP